MQIGIKTNPQDTTWDAMLATWERADEVDSISSAWVFDHFYPIFSDSNGPCFEGWTALTALTQATERLQVGTMVNGMPYRHPAVTANMAATLDTISRGRFQLGLGAGWNQEEADAYGISLGNNLTERFDMFDEGVEIIVSLLSNEHTTFAGRHYQLTTARNEPKGPQRPHPPIVIGGGGEKRTLRTVARWAQHWNSPPVGLDVWRHKRSVLDQHCADIDRDPDEILSSYMMRFDPAADPQTVRAEVKELHAAGVDKFIFNLPAPHDPDDVERVADLVTPLL